jgi:uncharacterized protein involved in exopolysaccharide biosynthesis
MGIVNALLRNVVFIAVLALGAGAAAGAYSLTQPRTYTSSASFVPKLGAASTGGLAQTIATQFGMGVSAAGPGAQFYADLLRSHQVLRELVETPFEVSTDTGRVRATFIALQNLEGVDSLQAVERSIEIARGAVAVRTRNTGVVQFDVTATNPGLATAMAGRLLELLNEFNLEMRQSQASAERQFTESRLVEASTELLDAERRLERFLQSNRQLNAPHLLLEHDRLQREVVMRQQVVNALVQVFEQARIEEVRNTPVITVIEPPITPIRPNGRGTTRRVALGLLAGLMVGMTVVGLRELREFHSANPTPQFREFQEISRSLRHDLRHPLRALWRRVRGR